MKRTSATEEERDVYKTEMLPDVRGAFLKKSKIHVGKETVRRAACPEFPQLTTSRFEGVNASGWLFMCKGGMVPNPETKRLFQHEGHRFVAAPPDAS